MKVLLPLFLLLLLIPQDLFGQANTGFGLHFTANNYEVRDAKSKENYATSPAYGLSGDYQFATARDFSVLVVTGEQVGQIDNPQKSDHDFYKTGFIGLEARIWRKQFFLGGGVGQSFLTYIKSFEQYNGLQWGNRMSISGGLELDTGLSSSFSLVKIDTFEFDDMKSQDIVGTRFTIGYRWK